MNFSALVAGVETKWQRAIVVQDIMDSIKNAIPKANTIIGADTIPCFGKSSTGSWSNWRSINIAVVETKAKSKLRPSVALSVKEPPTRLGGK